MNKSQTLSQLIASRFGATVQADYERLLYKHDLDLAHHFVTLGINLGRNIQGEDVPSGLIEECYNKYRQDHKLIS